MTLSEIKRQVNSPQAQIRRRPRRRPAPPRRPGVLRRVGGHPRGEKAHPQSRRDRPVVLHQGIPAEGPPFLHGLHQPLQEDQGRPIAHGHRQGPHALAVLPPHYRKPDPPRLLLRAPSGSHRPHQPPRPRGRIPDHDLEPPQPGTHTRLTP